MAAAEALYARAGFEVVGRRGVAAKSGAFELRSLAKALAPPTPLVALPLVAADRSPPKVTVAASPSVADGGPRVARFVLPQPLHATLGLVFAVGAGGARFVARRALDANAAPTLPAGAVVACELRADAPPVWAWPRRVNTFRPRKPPKADRPDDCDEEGPCTCNADCVLA